MNARVARKANGSKEVPELLRCLFQEHRHLNALVRVMLNKINQIERFKLVDYYLLRDIIGYLHDYPNEVHHPLENRLFTVLVKRKPTVSKAVQRLRHDHEIVSQKTQELLELLDQAIEDPSMVNDTTVRRACRDFGWHQQEHMKFEDLEIFPEALASMTAADWQRLESHKVAVNDPLFGNVVGNSHRLLYEYLVDSALEASEKFSIPPVFSLQRLVKTGEIVGKGVGSCCSRLGELGQSLAGETVTTVRQTVKPASLGSAVGLPVRYATFMTRSLVDCGKDLVGIWTRSARDTLALYRSRQPFK